MNLDKSVQSVANTFNEKNLYIINFWDAILDHTQAAFRKEIRVHLGDMFMVGQEHLVALRHLSVLENQMLSSGGAMLGD